MLTSAELSVDQLSGAPAQERCGQLRAGAEEAIRIITAWNTPPRNDLPVSKKGLKERWRFFVRDCSDMTRGNGSKLTSG